jgi:hypothetical protein
VLELIAAAFVLSIDNVRLAGALGVLESSARRWCCLAVLMAVVESMFPLIGAAAAPIWATRVASLAWLGALALLVTATLFLVGVVGKPLPRAGWMIYTLPILFGLDNLLAGAALGLPGTRGMLDSLFVGLLSGAVSLVTMVAVGRGAALLAPRLATVQLIVVVTLGLSFFVLP